MHLCLGAGEVRDFLYKSSVQIYLPCLVKALLSAFFFILFTFFNNSLLSSLFAPYVSYRPPCLFASLNYPTLYSPEESCSSTTDNTPSLHIILLQIQKTSQGMEWAPYVPCNIRHRYTLHIPQPHLNPTSAPHQLQHEHHINSNDSTTSPTLPVYAQRLFHMHITA